MISLVNIQVQEIVNNRLCPGCTTHNDYLLVCITEQIIIYLLYHSYTKYKKNRKKERRTEQTEHQQVHR